MCNTTSISNMATVSITSPNEYEDELMHYITSPVHRSPTAAMSPALHPRTSKKRHASQLEPERSFKDFILVNPAKLQRHNSVHCTSDEALRSETTQDARQLSIQKRQLNDAERLLSDASIAFSEEQQDLQPIPNIRLAPRLSSRIDIEYLVSYFE